MHLLRIILAASLSLAIVSARAEQDAELSAHLRACNAAIGDGDASKALAYAERALQKEADNREALLCKGRAHGGIGQNKQALAALQAAEKASATPLEHMVARTLIGNVQNSDGQSGEAIASYRQSLAVAEQSQNKAFQRINRNLIADIQLQNNEALPALENYLTASDFAANDNERADSYARIAAAHSKLGQHDLAIEYQLKAALAEERSGDFNHYAHANLELGLIYSGAGEFANAEKVINKIIDDSQQQGTTYWQARGYYAMARVKLASGLPLEGRRLLLDAQKIADDIGAEALSEEVGQHLLGLTKK